MTSIEYRAMRESAGSQALVARALGLNITTIQRRESGMRQVSREAEIAIRQLVNQVAGFGRLVGKMGRPKKL